MCEQRNKNNNKIDDYIPNNDVIATLATRSILLKVADDKKFLES